MPFVNIEGWGLFLSTRKKLFSQKLNCHRVSVSTDPKAPCVLSPGQFQQWLLFNMLCVISYLPAPGRIAPSYFLNWKKIQRLIIWGFFSILIKSFFFGWVCPYSFTFKNDTIYMCLHKKHSRQMQAVKCMVRQTINQR